MSDIKNSAYEEGQNVFYDDPGANKRKAALSTAAKFFEGTSDEYMKKHAQSFLEKFLEGWDFAEKEAANMEQANREMFHHANDRFPTDEEYEDEFG